MNSILFKLDSIIDNVFELYDRFFPAAMFSLFAAFFAVLSANCVITWVSVWLAVIAVMCVVFAVVYARDIYNGKEGF